MGVTESDLIRDTREVIAVSIQGERGSFSEEATLLLLGKGIEFHCCEAFEEVFRATSQGQTRYCVVPIENSLAGSIHKNYDLLLRYGLKIVQEVNLPIQHHLIGVEGTTFDQIRTVMSHPVALDQCERFFERFPHLIKQTAYDTSGSVKRIVSKNMRDCAGIAGARAAEYYKGEILMRGIEDNEENFTRFFLLSPERETAEAANKVSIVFSFQNTPGALFKCLSVFASREIDLAKIESRPIHGRPWEYLFYLDFQGSVDEDRTREALNDLERIAEFMEILGCYPSASSQEDGGRS